MERKHITWISWGLIAFLTVAVIILSVLLGVFVTKYNNAKSVKPVQTELPGLDFVMNTTWDSLPVSHKPTTISLRWNEYNKAVNLKFSSALFNNPPRPNHTAGVVERLYNYEVFEIFFLNSKNQYMELELGPYNQWIVYLLYEKGQYANMGDFLQLSVWNQLTDNTWEGEVEIPLAYLPANFTLLNAYNYHKDGNTKVYEALFPAPYGVYKGPDFHRLDLFKSVDRAKIIPDEYFSETKPFRDERYPDVLAGYY